MAQQKKRKVSGGDTVDWITILQLAEVGEDCKTLLEALEDEEDPNIFGSAKPRFQQLLQNILGGLHSNYIDAIMRSAYILKECSDRGLDVRSLSLAKRIQLTLLAPSACSDPI